MQKYFPTNAPNRYSLAGYFAGMLFTEGAKRAGRNLTRESLVAALGKIKGWESGILPRLTIGPDHETQKQGFWVRVEKGRFKPLPDSLKGGQARSRSTTPRPASAGTPPPPASSLTRPGLGPA